MGAIGVYSFCQLTSMAEYETRSEGHTKTGDTWTPSWYFHCVYSLQRQNTRNGVRSNQKQVTHGPHRGGVFILPTHVNGKVQEAISETNKNV